MAKEHQNTGKHTAYAPKGHLGKRLYFTVISALFALLLIVGVLAAALSRTTGESRQTKRLLQDSGMYTAVILSQASQVKDTGATLAGLLRDSPEIQNALISSLGEQKVQAEGNKAVDGIYDWLEGVSSKPRINIDASLNPDLLAASIGKSAAKRAASLPTCSISETLFFHIPANPLDAACLPIGVSPETAGNLVAGHIAAIPALREGIEITENDIKLSDGRTAMDAFAAAPVWYQRAKSLPILAAMGAAVFGLLIVLAIGLRRGIRTIGIHLLAVGVAVSALVSVAVWSAGYISDALIPNGMNPHMAVALGSLAKVFIEAYQDNILLLSLPMAAVGLVLLAINHLVNKRRPKLAAAAITIPAPIRTINTPEQQEPWHPTTAPLLPDSRRTAPAESGESGESVTAGDKKPVADPPARRRIL